MIHEALFMLWNCPGELFKTTSEEEWLDDVELREFLHPGERKLLQNIMNIALSYHNIEEFRKMVANQQTIQYKVPVTKNNEDKEVAVSYNVNPGLYIKAFCNGLDEVLQSYRNEIVSLEDKFLKNPHLTLIYVVGCMERYITLFEVLLKMIRMVKMEHMHGSLFMGPIHMYVIHGIPIVIDAADKIIKCVNKMFYRHLCNWIIYGDLVDIYNEFFICDGKCADENFLYPEQLNEDEDNIETSHNFRKKRIMRPCTVRKFYIKTEMLPSILSPETAETILFMGRIVWIVRNDPEKTTDDNYQLKFKRDIWEGKDVEYYQTIQLLENYPFNYATFYKTIEKCRLKLTKYLWKIMVEEAKLLEHLQLVRDYYGLGRGELFQQFIIAAENQLKETPNDYIIKNLNFVFTESARKMYGENDKSYQKFELALAKSFDNDSNQNPWTRLEINFDILWPLHIIFHPKSIELYNKLFCFLLRITKTHIDLQRLWQIHMACKEQIDRTVWTLRHNLMFLVNNLQYYLQVDVIEAEFSVLKEAVKNADEFEDIIRLHSKFLSNLLCKTFVMSEDTQNTDVYRHTLYQLPPLNFEKKNMIYSVILLLLELCDEFCLLASMWDAKLNAAQQNELEKLKQRSDSLTDMLLRVLKNVHAKVSGSHLLQLLHHLDFNHWYSKNKSDFNLSIS